MADASSPNEQTKLRAREPSEGTAQANPRKILGLVIAGLGVIVGGFYLESAVEGGRSEPATDQATASVVNTSAITPYGLDELPDDYGDLVFEAEDQNAGGDPAAQATEPGQQGATSRAPPDPAAEAARRLREEALRSPLIVQRTRAQPAATSASNGAAGTPLEQLRNTAGELDPGQQRADTTNQNLQAAKLAFLQSGSYGGVLLDRPYLPPAGEHLVQAGTSIPAALITGLNSDLPGDIVAQVIEPVHDTVTGNHLLIPAGAKLIGRYDSLITFGQDRALMVWDRLIMPNGYSIQLDQLSGTDAAGQAGVADQVDFHYRRLALGVLLSTFVSVGAQVARGDRDEGDIRREAGDGLATEVNRVSRSIAERYLDVQPTITVRPGWPVRVSVNRDIRLAPYVGLGG